MMTLTELADFHGSDKGSKGPSPDWPAHNYTDVYEAYFAAMRDQPVRLLEIGLGVDGPEFRAYIQQGRNQRGGASIRMWRDYFTKGQIFGIDVNPAEHLDDEQVTTFVADQGNLSDLQRFVDTHGSEFDIIVDDGSHRPDHQQTSLGFLFHHLLDGGLYVIEDLQSNGAGDSQHKRSSVSTVANTRAVIREYAETGSFGQPNCIPEPEGLAGAIRHVRFHCPPPRLRGKPRARRPGKLVESYIAGRERVCVLIHR